MDLPTEIHDNIAFFLPDKDLLQFVCASPRHIVVSAYLLRERQRAYWKKSPVKHLAARGDLVGLQYLYDALGSGSGGKLNTTGAMYGAADEGHLAVVQYLHGRGVKCTADALDGAAFKGHLPVVQFLHSIGVLYTRRALDWAAQQGHLGVVQYLVGIGAPCTNDAMDWATYNGHLAVVKLLHGYGAPYTERAVTWAYEKKHLALLEFLRSGRTPPFRTRGFLVALSHILKIKNNYL